MDQSTVYSVVSQAVLIVLLPPYILFIVERSEHHIGNISKSVKDVRSIPILM